MYCRLLPYETIFLCVYFGGERHVLYLPSCAPSTLLIPSYICMDKEEKIQI